VAQLPGGGQTAFSDGLILRMMFHGTTPDSCIEILAQPSLPKSHGLLVKDPIPNDEKTRPNFYLRRSLGAR